MNDIISRQAAIEGSKNMMYVNETTCEPQERAIPTENAKVLLENTDAILHELDDLTRAIESGIFSPLPCGVEENREPRDECMLGTLNRQRHKTEEILKRVIHIREGLW